MAPPIAWTAARKARLIALGRDGLDWAEIGVQLACREHGVETAWYEFSSRSDRAVRNAVREQARIGPGLYAGPRAKPETRAVPLAPCEAPAGGHFEDSPKAADNHGSYRTPRRVEWHSGCGCSAAWAVEQGTAR